MKAFIGRYFKTKIEALNYYDKQDDWFRDNHYIVQFKNCWMIISSLQVKALGSSTFHLICK